jgi:1-phosphofructokinase
MSPSPGREQIQWDGDSEAFPLDAATVTLNPAIDRTITISRFTAGTVNRVEAERDNPGGKGVNVASALAGSGLRTAVTGFLGGENAEVFEAHFTRQNIVDHFVRVPGRTRVGIKIVDPDLKQTTDINFPGLAPRPGEVAALWEKLGALRSAWWVVAGSLPPGMDAGIYREIVASLKARGARVALDASGEALRQGIAAGPHVVKPNLSELETLLGERIAGTDAIIAAARQLLDQGIELVTVSMGREGACFVTAAETVIARPRDVEVGSTVGAGDAMVAGIVAAQLRGLPLEDCAKLATAFSLQRLTSAEGNPEAAMDLITTKKIR